MCKKGLGERVCYGGWNKERWDTIEGGGKDGVFIMEDLDKIEGYTIEGVIRRKVLLWKGDKNGGYGGLNKQGGYTIDSGTRSEGIL